jgi:DNA-binding transcriptional ArsR family regulator
MSTANGTPLADLPDWAREQLGTAAPMILPPDVDPDAEVLVDHIRFLETELTELSERAAHGFREPEDRSRSYSPFPVDVLPDRLAAYVRAASEATPCPPAMVAVPMMSVLAGAVGAAACLRLKRGWKEHPILWTAVVAPSGTAKSPAAHHAWRPLARREEQAAEEYEREMERYQKLDEEAQAEAEEPTRDRYRIGDITREKVARVLNDNPRGVALVRDELATWIESFDRYAQGAADLHAWLAYYEARQDTVDRVNGEDLILKTPAVSVAGTIQPGTLRKKLGEIHFETGFAPRMMLAMPPTKPKTWTTAEVTHEVIAGYRTILDRLYGVPMGTEVTLSPEAETTWGNWLDAAYQLQYDMEEGPAASVASKTVGHAARIALLLHLTEQPPEKASAPMTVNTIRRGQRLATWFRSETLRVYDELGLVDGALQPIDRFYRALPSRFQTADAKDVAGDMGTPERTMYNWLNRLRERGQVEKLKQGRYRKTDV